MKKITFLIACLLAVFGMSAINHYDNLYVVGDACAAGWSPDDALEMTKVGDGQFTWTGELLDKTGDRRFKFLVGRAGILVLHLIPMCPITKLLLRVFLQSCMTKANTVAMTPLSK